MNELLEFELKTKEEVRQVEQQPARAYGEAPADEVPFHIPRD